MVWLILRRGCLGDSAVLKRRITLKKQRMTSRLYFKALQLKRCLDACEPVFHADAKTLNLLCLATTAKIIHILELQPEYQLEVCGFGFASGFGDFLKPFIINDDCPVVYGSRQ